MLMERPRIVFAKILGDTLRRLPQSNSCQAATPIRLRGAGGEVRLPAEVGKKWPAKSTSTVRVFVTTVGHPSQQTRSPLQHRPGWCWMLLLPQGSLRHDKMPFRSDGQYKPPEVQCPDLPGVPTSLNCLRCDASIGHRDRAVLRRASLEVVGDLPLGSEASGHKASLKVAAIPTCFRCSGENLTAQAFVLEKFVARLENEAAARDFVFLQRGIPSSKAAGFRLKADARASRALRSRGTSSASARGRSAQLGCSAGLLRRVAELEALRIPSSDRQTSCAARGGLASWP